MGLRLGDSLDVFGGELDRDAQTIAAVVEDGDSATGNLLIVRDNIHAQIVTFLLLALPKPAKSAKSVAAVAHEHDTRGKG